MTEQSTSADGRDRSTDPFDVEKAARYAAVAALVAYVLGLLIVNTYLYQIGVSDFAVLRTRFILTGALALLMFAALGIFVVWAMLAATALVAGWRAETRKPTWRSRMAFVLTSQITLLLVVSLSAALLLVPWLSSAGVHLRANLTNRLSDGGDLLLLSVTAMGGAFLFPRLGKETQDFAARPLHQFGMFSILLLWVGLFGFFSLDLFASTVYPAVPEQFGGGRPKAVVIVLSAESSALGSALGFGPATTERVSRRVDLLWETDQVYVLRDPSGPNDRIIRLDRDAVSAVVSGPDAPPAATPVAAPVASPAAPPNIVTS